ncbi:MAG: NTP transferase domain-containing protein [Actinobacteria bacterium]|nr:NTP transferase domain-containing protein [Actinomycetota bacterium]MBV8395217.1 NTP transferase domain-containing protein [Actinomycetota bacterium]
MTTAVVLAAGEASRYGSPKQRVLLPRVLGRLAATSVGRVVVVEGAHPLADVLLPGIELAHCDEWRSGPGATLRCGLAAVGDEDGALVVLADGPNLDPRAVERVLDHRGDAAVVAASWGGVRSHPLWIARAAWDDVPNEGMHARPVVLVPCDDLEPPGDVDEATWSEAS